MKSKNFTVTIAVEKSPKEVFDAINNVGGWWQGVIEGSSSKLNDEFTYRIEEIHFSKQKVVELIPSKKITWLVTESKLNFIKDKNEWTGTKISFEIVETKNKTEIHFTHFGLSPDVECYSACSNGWDQLIKKSLFSLINTGKGKNVF